jgi:hypothetical protein
MRLRETIREVAVFAVSGLGGLKNCCIPGAKGVISDGPLYVTCLFCWGRLSCLFATKVGMGGGGTVMGYKPGTPPNGLNSENGGLAVI